MKENKYWLNEHGQRYWYKKSDVTITANRAYHWVDRIVFINECKVLWVKASDLIPYDHWTTDYI